MADIKFHARDRSELFETDVLEIAEHFKVRRRYFMSFTRLIKVSKRWSIANIETELGKWAENFSRNGSLALIAIVKSAFSFCRTTEQIHKLRGSIVEALVIAGHGGRDRLNDPLNFGWGASVVIQDGLYSVEVDYDCDNKCLQFQQQSCGDKSTVDIGHWNGRHGILYECKAFPDSIKCIDVEYLRKLSSELQSRRISHEIFFACLDSREEIEIKLRTNNAPSYFKACGLRELEAMIPA